MTTAAVEAVDPSLAALGGATLKQGAQENAPLATDDTDKKRAASITMVTLTIP